MRAFVLAFAASLSIASQGAPANGSADSFKASIQPILKEYCLSCHSTEKQKGDLDLERFSSVADALKQPKVWQAVIEQVGHGEMPPKSKPQPTAPQRDQILKWANSVLDDAATARAGDPGPVVLRRLSNAEYTYTVRDLTGVISLDPAKEFPVDGASGEGFMNVGNSLVMSPSLITKYLDAGKAIASHAMLVPDGIRFSANTTRRDWTEEILAEIRAIYSAYTQPGGGSAVNLQGIKFDTKDGGVLPLEKYISATVEAGGTNATAEKLSSIASQQGLSSKYLLALWTLLKSPSPSILLDPIRARWRTATAADSAGIASEIAAWQQALWKFNSVGHIGKAGGPKAWLEPFSPLVSKQELRFKIPASADGKNVTVYLAASDAGDGNRNDLIVWQQPRLVAPGRPDLLLRDVRAVNQELAARRQAVLGQTAKALAAAAEIEASDQPPNLPRLASSHGIDTNTLAAWLDYLGMSASGVAKIDTLFTNQLKRASNYDFISGWGSGDTPSLMANSSDQHVRIPGNMKPRSVAVHPSPKLAAVVGWRSPMAGRVTVDATVQHAHPECGNGVTWSVEVRRGSTRQRLGSGVAQGSAPVKMPRVENVMIRVGDVVCIAIGPRDGNHSCDLTAVDLAIDAGAPERQWDLAKDVSPNVLAGNPHADRHGNKDVWNFYVEPAQTGPAGPVIPPGSVIAKWQTSSNATERQKLAEQAQALLAASQPKESSPDSELHRQLTSANGPLLRDVFRNITPNASASLQNGAIGIGVDPKLFGARPDGSKIDAANICAHAPSIVEVQLPADLAAGAELVATVVPDPMAGREGSFQAQILASKPGSKSGLLPVGVTSKEGEGPWYSNNRQVTHAAPIVVAEGSEARKRIEADLESFRQVFPAALCYTKIVPVDEVVTLTLYHREDHHLMRLLLGKKDSQQLDRLWDQLHFVSQDALTLVDVFEQLWQYATQDADPKVFEPMREPIKQRAAAFRQRLKETQPQHLDAVLKFANDAYRRPITEAESAELRGLYAKLREQELPHDEAIRLTLARVLIAPAFLYRLEKPGAGSHSSPINDWELASRLSYFLWSSAPDTELRAAAAQGKLHDPDVLVAQANRMMRDGRVRRLATEFGCAWLHIYAFDELSEKSERHFPTFTDLRGAMYEESIRFFTDLFQNNRPVLSLLNADYTFVNEALAKHYGIPGVTGPEWRKVDGASKYSRGGILALGSTLAKQSGASRTSPILRGNWVTEVLLGEKLPRPPKDVPRLPEDEATENLTVRQLTEKHTSDPRCAGCHARIDAFGFALEGFDAIGRRRERDLGDRPIDARAKAPDGTEFADGTGLRDYILSKRRDDFLGQFCRKLLGYALAREVQLSDRPLLNEMRERLKAGDYQISAAVETIVRSRQFREIRGRDAAAEDFASNNSQQ